MKEVLKLMQERQSVRMPFETKRTVAKKDLLQILEAARWTPTASIILSCASISPQAL